MSSPTFHTASMSAQVVFCGEVLKAKRIQPRYIRSTRERTARLRTTSGGVLISAMLDDVSPVPRARYLLRAKDLMDSRYFESLTVPDLAGAARLSPAHF